MNIDLHSSRLLSTVAIWIATALIFIFGFCRMNASGAALLPWFVIGLALALGPAFATAAIWNFKPQSKQDQTSPEVPRDTKPGI
jgi:hypothetical protein